MLQNIDEKWSDLQKIAFVDNAIGKKMSYDPTFDTEVFNGNNSRALWKIIHSGYGVCNGISQVEKYILDQIGIESEIVSGKRHAFLKIKNLTYKTIDGVEKKGDTILDPTWNLKAHKFGSRPPCFCISYDKIRELDIDDDEVDQKCHENDIKLSNATLELDDETLRQVFSSLGLADEYGVFPMYDFTKLSEQIGKRSNISEEETVIKQLQILQKYYPDCAKWNNETTAIIENLLLNQPNQNFKRCVVSRAYRRKDENKIPILYIYIDFPTIGKKFYIIDKKDGKIKFASQEKFESVFECYERDMEKLGGHRPWEDVEEERIESTMKKNEEIVSGEGTDR